MDMLRSLATFVRAAESRSLSAVARGQHESATAVTRQVGALEAHFGVRLLHRTTRRLSLTPDGAELLAHARALLDAAQAMEDGFGQARGKPSGLVRFGCSVGFSRFLQPRLKLLLDRHPALQLDMVISDHLGDLVEARLDLAVAPLGERRDASSLVVRRLGEIQRILVAAPAYLARHGAPASLENLAGHECVTHSGECANHPGPGRHATWRLQGPQGPVQVEVAGRFSTDNSGAQFAAVQQGWGIGLLAAPMVRDDLNRQALCRVLPDYATQAEPALLLFPSKRHLPPRTRAVIDFVVEVYKSGADYPIRLP